MLAILSLAMAQDGKIRGQTNVKNNPVTWNTGANYGKTSLRFLSNAVYLDTSTTGQLRYWKRIDNTADSCSQPYLIADSLGNTYATWQYRLDQLIRSVDAESGGVAYRIQTRVPGMLNGKMQWRPWTVKGANAGLGSDSIKDSVLFPPPRSTSRVSQYAEYRVNGVQARLCPDDDVTTANGAADTVYTDSIFGVAR